MQLKQELGVELMSKIDEIKDNEMLVLTIEYLESLIVPTKDLGFIFIAICNLKKAINEEGVCND